jgi:inosine-uridine nucleoside N-ribohydrolase
MKKSIFIDTDAGVDDIVAICMLIASKQFTIKAISVVNGVASVGKGMINLSRILQYIGKPNILLYKGYNQISQRASIQFPAIDRKRANTLSLLSNIQLPNGAPRSTSIANLGKRIASEPKPITLLCLGPLTNIAFLLQNQKVRNNIKRIFIMGGALRVPGIVPPGYRTEYNIRLDPRSADYVFRSGIPMTLIPIDATQFVPAISGIKRQALAKVSLKYLKQITSLQPQAPAGKIMQSIIRNNKTDFNSFYDPLLAGIVILPSLVLKNEQCSVRVSCKQTSFGVTKIIENTNNNAIIPTTIDSRAFYQLVIQLLY